MNSIKLGNQIIDATTPPYIIAEIGVNHEGSLEKAKELIELAKEGGANAAKFQTYKADYVSLPDRISVALEQAPIEKMGLHEIIACPHCNRKTPFDGYVQHCVHCGERLNTVIKVCPNGEQKVAYHPTFTYCPNCGAELVPEIYEGPPLTEMDPNGLIWGIPLQDETTEDGDLFGGPPSPPGPPLS